MMTKTTMGLALAAMVGAMQPAMAAKFTTAHVLDADKSKESVKKDFLALALMIDIVEQLNLNLRIWTKE